VGIGSGAEAEREATLSDGAVVTTWSPQPARTGAGANKAPARRTRAVPSDSSEQGQCKSALMVVRLFESIRIHTGN